MKLYSPLEDKYPITGTWGKRQSMLIDGVWTLPFHYGIDWAAPAGTPIYASMAGTVSKSGWDFSTYGGGNEVAVTDGKYRTWYLHLVRPSHLSVGNRVKVGDLIGYVGSTGVSTGAHLHFEFHINGSAVDPAKYLTKNSPEQQKKVDTMPNSTRITYRPKGGRKVTNAWSYLPINAKGDVTIIGGGSKGRHAVIYCNLDVAGTVDLRAVIDKTSVDGSKVQVSNPTFYERITRLGTYAIPVDIPAGHRLRMQAKATDKTPVNIVQIGYVADYWDK